MPPRAPLAPHVVASVPGSSAFATDLAAIPGVRIQQERLTVPHHALALAAAKLEKVGLSVANARWAVPSPSTATWEEVEAHLETGGEVREFVLDGFLVGYQKDALSYAFRRSGVHFWHPTGSGKTLSGLLYGLCGEGAIVIVTRAASRLQYGREVERFTTIRPYVVRPSAQMKKGAQTLLDYIASTIRPIVVVGWESLQDNLDALTGMRPGTVIFDESHRGKSSKRWEPVPLPETDDPKVVLAQESEARMRGGFITDGDGGRLMMVPVENTASSAARLARASKRRVCTTATPIKDRVRDLWAQLDLAEPDAWGNATCWLNRYADRKPGTYGGFDTTGSSNLEELAERLNYVVHRIDYAETHRSLPPKRRQSVYVSVEDQVKPTGGFQKELNDAAKRGASALLEVKLALAASKKRKAVLGLIEDHLNSGHKVVLFTGRRRDCEELGKSFKDVKAKVWASHGGDSTAFRQQVVDEYMAHPGPCLLVGTGDAFGESINLQDTDAALFVMLPWTPGQVRQWEGRFCRMGQKRPVVIYYVVAEETVDEQVADKLISKLPAVEAVAKDEELAAARAFIAGTDDTDALADSILSKLLASEGEKEDVD